MVADGQVLSLNAGTNSESADLATFFLDSRNNPFIRYMQTTMLLYTNGTFLTNIISYNSIGAEIHSPVIVSRAAMDSTAAVDARVHDTTKFVVENNFVSRISTATVETPENGFVIIIPAASMPYYARFLTVGTRVNFSVTTDLNVDFSSINAAIGGGPVILAGGVPVEGGVQPNVRHPRTAVGELRDGRIILMVVDGRTHSIGVTHAELGAILQRYGAVNAMHMDGGGSTTMVTRTANGAYSVANTVSDGSQRAITNALGVFNNAPMGEIVQIVLEPAETRAVQGVPLRMEIFGQDEWGNRITLNEEITPRFSATTGNGFWNGNIYTPLRPGTHRIIVEYGEFRTMTPIEVYALGELQPRHEIINLLENGRVRLRFSGVATDGTQVNIPEVTTLAVFPSELGFFEDGYFVAARGGVGYIQAAVGSINAFIPVSVGGFPWPVNMHATHIDFLSTPPEYVSTRVTSEVFHNRDSIRLNYTFGRTHETQASYVTFYPAIAIPGEPIALRMQVFGDNSGHWLRGRVRDADGEFHNITFTRELDFTGWNTLIASLPNAPAPFAIDRIYAVELESFETSQHSLVFSNLEALYAPNHNIPVPRGTGFVDRFRVTRDFQLAGSSFYEFAIPSANENMQLEVSASGTITTARISARNGGIQATNIEQWRYFMPMIRGLNSRFVVILLDENPLNFSRRMERELFHLAMTELRDEGRTVFVVSATADETVLTMRDNIRYINVARQEAPTIRFWTHDDIIRWSD
jgi:hypothetical protein